MRNFAAIKKEIEDNVREQAATVVIELANAVESANGECLKMSELFTGLGAVKTIDEAANLAIAYQANAFKRLSAAFGKTIARNVEAGKNFQSKCSSVFAAA